MHAAVAHVHTIDDGIPKWSSTLDDSPAHDRDMVARRRSFKGLATARCEIVFLIVNLPHSDHTLGLLPSKLFKR
jgi:hypothetical protein